MLPKVHKPDNFESHNSQKLSFTNIQDLCFNFVWYESFRRKKHHRTNQGSNFLGGSFSNRDNVRAPIQFRGESQPQHLKRWFFFKNRPIHFHINSNSVIKPVKQNQQSFSSIEISKLLPVPVHSLSKIRFKFKSQF